MIAALRANIVRHLLYPLHEWARGRPTLACLRRTARAMLATRDEAALHHDATARDALLHAATLPFYQMRFAQAGVDLAEDPDSGRVLGVLPPLRKSEIRAHEAEMLDRSVRGGLLPSSSGGTSGDKLHFYTDKRSQADGLATRLFFQALLGVPPGARRMYVWGSPIENRGGSAKRWRDALLNEQLINAFLMSADERRAHLERIRAYQPRLIYGYPTAIDLLAATLLEDGAAPPVAALRVIVLTGEEVCGEQRARIAQAFGARVVAEYGSRETGIIGHECARGMLHRAPHLHVSVHANGADAGCERPGELLVTPLLRRAQPLLAYGIGDVGELRTEACSCGLPLPALRVLGGKITGFIALPSGRLCHGAVTSHVLRNEAGIIAFRTIQHDFDQFEVLLETSDAFEAGARDRIVRRYRDLFGSDIRVAVRQVDALPPDPSGKRRYVISHVAADVTRGITARFDAAPGGAAALQGV